MALRLAYILAGMIVCVLIPLAAFMVVWGWFQVSAYLYSMFGTGGVFVGLIILFGCIVGGFVGNRLWADDKK